MGVTVAFRFLAGRYHATPWDSHVNEGEVEWPPSPWRLLRSFVATWHRKVDPQQFPEVLLDTLISKLAIVHPLYRLPPATRFHKRHYMPTGRLASGGEKTTLLFDAFVHVGPEESLVVHWPGVELTEDERQLLEVLLERLGYLGRAESWVEAALAEPHSELYNCFPADRRVGVEPDEGLETIRLAAPCAPAEYLEWRGRVIAEYGLDRSRLSQREQRLLATLPESLTDTLRLETSAVRAQRWSRMPGMKFVAYRRPADCFRPRHIAVPRTTGRRPQEPVTSVRLVLAGKPLPRLEDAVRVGDAIRNAAVGRARDISPSGSAPWILTGRDIPKGLTHAHAYYLPEDADGDGRIDHVFVFAAAGFDRDAVRALASIAWVGFMHRPQDGRWQVVLEGFGQHPEYTGTVYAGTATVWESVTPYLRPWHAKKGFGSREQVRRECSLMGLPPLRDVQVLETVPVKGRLLRPVHFHRFRSKQGLPQPDTRGTFLRLTFERPVRGPLALGFASHFGLGLFRPLG